MPTAIALNPNGTVTYTLTIGYIDVDTFSCQISDKRDILFNAVAVTATVNNAVPNIATLTMEAIVAEGKPAQFSASAIAPGNDVLIYT